MDTGIYASAAGMLNQFNTENNISDNLANMQTPGYKERAAVIEDFALTLRSSYDGLSTASGNHPTIGRFGLPPQIQDYGLDLAQGNPRSTGSPLDLMIVGNGFFTVDSGGKTLLTRNGSFHRSATGLLVTNEGYPVLNTAGHSIKIPAGHLTINRSGELSVNGTRIDRLGLAGVQVGAPLTEAGGGYYQGAGVPLPARAAGTAVLQGYLESSNVDLTTQTTAMMSAQRTYQADSKMLQIQDDTLGLAVNDLGKVSG